MVGWPKHVELSRRKYSKTKTLRPPGICAPSDVTLRIPSFELLITVRFFSSIVVAG